jgi:hypothetical protein
MTKKKPETSVSREVLEHHVALHNAQCPGRDIRELLCTCGTTMVLICGTSEEELFMATRPGPYCKHAAELMEQQEGLWP